jgi:hypothetical protein
MPLPSLTEYRLSYPLGMSSTVAFSSNFRSIFDTALSDYTKQTGIDLITHPCAQTLQYCDSADEILELFREKANQHQGYRDGNKKLINYLRPVVQVLHTVAGEYDEATSLVSLAIVSSYLIA